jgi:hypothetical protein
MSTHSGSLVSPAFQGSTNDETGSWQSVLCSWRDDYGLKRQQRLDRLSGSEVESTRGLSLAGMQL